MGETDTVEQLLIYEKLGLSILIGVLLGAERGWKTREHEDRHGASGLRTFALIGLLGGVWALLSQIVGQIVLGFAFLVFAALIVTSYHERSKAENRSGITTEVAEFLTFGLGALAVLGDMAVAASCGVVTLAFLSFKKPIHQWIDAIKQEELVAAIKLLVISVVLLPVLPDQGYGPGDYLNPYKLWWLVVLISAISFVGYFAIKIAGPQLGTSLTAMFGGITSSTAVTLSFSRRGKSNVDMQRVLASGIAIATGVMFLRVLLIIWVVNPTLGLGMAWILGGMSAIAFTGALALWLDRQGTNGKAEMSMSNPFDLTTAIQFSAFLTAILLLSHYMQDWMGNVGLYGLSALSGLADVDAISLSMGKMAQSHEDQKSIASACIIIAASVNTLVKGGIASSICGGLLAKRVWLVIIPCIALGIVSFFVG